MRSFIALASSLAIASIASAEVTVQLSEVHLCCKSCVNGVGKALTGVTGASAKADQDSETVTITAADAATAQKAVDALTSAGYFGVSSDKSIKVNSATGATDAKVHSLAVEDVHLCCNKCVKAVGEALKSVPGVTGNTASKEAKSFQVTGDFKPTDVFKALQDAGLTGKAGKSE